MVVGLLFGAETYVTTEVSETTEIANEYMYNIQETKVIAPTIAPTYTITHNPILQFNSPSGSIGGSPTTVTPAVTGTEVSPQLIPSQVVAQSAETLQSAEAGGGGMMDYILVIAVVVIGAIFILPMLLKKKGKKKIKMPLAS
ncbi:hypothetical protein ES702_07295 [subsurface metagenome]